MQLTWFGGTTFRIHIGGKMLVVEAEAAPGRIDRTELLSGADKAFTLADDLPAADAQKWAPRKVGALIDANAVLPEALVFRLAPEVVLVEAVGEPPLLVATGEVPEAGRWGREAVVIVAGSDLPRTAASVINQIRPRLIALAGGEHAIEETIATVRHRLEDTGLMAMEPALALEI